MTRADSVQLGRTVPAWTVRVLGAISGLWVGWALLPVPLWMVTVTALTLIGVVFPRTLTAWAPVAMITIGLLAEPPSPSRLALALLGVHLVHVCAALGWATPALSRFTFRALAPTARRFVAGQIGAQLVAVVIVAATTTTEAVIPGAIVLVGLATAGIVLLLARRLR